MPEALRIMVFGGPKTGKSTLAKRFCHQMGCTYFPSEKLLGLGYNWGQLATRAQDWLRSPAPWVMEGLSVPRIIRRWLKENREPLPCDEIWHLGYDAHVAITPGQVAAAKAVETVWKQCLRQLYGRFDGNVWDRDGQLLARYESVRL